MQCIVALLWHEIAGNVWYHFEIGNNQHNAHLSALLHWKLGLVFMSSLVSQAVVTIVMPAAACGYKVGIRITLGFQRASPSGKPWSGCLCLNHINPFVYCKSCCIRPCNNKMQLHEILIGRFPRVPFLIWFNCDHVMDDLSHTRFYVGNNY